MCVSPHACCEHRIVQYSVSYAEVVALNLHVHVLVQLHFFLNSVSLSNRLVGGRERKRETDRQRERQ